MRIWRGVTDNYIKSLNIDDEIEEIKTVHKTKWREEIVRILKEKHNILTSVKEISAWVYDYMTNQYANHIILKPSSRELLDRFSDEGVKMCVCTSSDRILIEPLLKNLDMEKYFDFTVHCKEYGKEKDEKDIFFHCMKELGAKNPSEVMVFEDALYSAKTAREHGFYVVGRIDDTEINQAELQRVSHQYVNSFHELDYTKLP